MTKEQIQQEALSNALVFCETVAKGLARLKPREHYTNGEYMNPAIDREAARITAWATAHPTYKVSRAKAAKFTLAELRNWKVDRSSGYLKVVNYGMAKRPTGKDYKSALARLLANPADPAAIEHARNLAA